MNWIRPNTTKTLYSAARFLIVGALSTLCTLTILYIAVEHFQSNVVLASTIGWFFGAILNYMLSYKYTFRSNTKHQLAIPRFAIVIASGIAINACLMMFFFSTLSLNYFLAQLIAVSLTVLTSFSLNLFWTFPSRA